MATARHYLNLASHVFHAAILEMLQVNYLDGDNLSSMRRATIRAHCLPDETERTLPNGSLKLVARGLGRPLLLRL